ncbi:MAG: metal ABC transporter permease [Thermoleophilaceae bacterium]|nr:metal ABC transporter permease [Thermoleophilaceae bacterium]
MIAAAAIDWITQPLEFEFMQRAILVGVIVGAVCAVLSCWLTLLGWSLLGDAVSHAVLPGVVLGYVLGLPLAAGAFVFGIGAVGMIGGLNRTSRVKEDAAIGIVFTGLFALGLVLVSAVPSQIDLFHILFGNILGVSNSDIVQVIVIGLLTLAALLYLRRSIVLFAFDPIHAHAIGMAPRWLEALLLGSMALTVVIALQAVGIVLVVAMLITPGAIGYLLTDRFDRMLLIAAVASIGSCIAGTYISYYADISTGGSIVLVLTVIFVLTYIFAPKNGLIAQRSPKFVSG